MMEGRLVGTKSPGAKDGSSGANAHTAPAIDPTRHPLRSWIVLAIAALLFPWIVPSTLVGAVNVGAAYALAAASLVLLTGWVGQISLGHAALVGIGAYTTGWVAGGLGLPFPFSLPVAAVVAGLAAALLGTVALRVRGLFLAVATLIFSWMASEFLFRQGWVTRHDMIPGRAIGGEWAFPFFDFTDRRTFYFVAWALVAAFVYLAANVRDSKTGRAFFAIRGSEMAAASLGIDVTRYKLVAFACSGALAGAAGNLMMTDSRVVTADQFSFTWSLFFVAVAVVGGLQSLGGAVAAGLLFAGLSELFFRVPALGGYLELVSALMLALVLLLYRGGLAAAGQALATHARRAPDGHGRKLGPSIARRVQALRRVSMLIPDWSDKEIGLRLTRFGRVIATPLLRFAASRRVRELRPEPALEWTSFTPTQPDAARSGKEASDNGQSHGRNLSSLSTRRLAPLPSRHSSPVTTPREERRALIQAEKVTMRFGGLTAVREASLDVHEGEIVGLIGPNGAGKTTLFNCIAGFLVPQQGTIRLFGQDVTEVPVHSRARLGVARTFQTIQLFGQLNVFQNLLVATHVHNPTGLFSHAVAGSRAISEEVKAQTRVSEVLELLDLEHVASEKPADLPFGTLRMVEVARALVTGFRLIMLDEPASGLDNVETDRLTEVLRAIRALGVTMLLIEHDVRMVTGVSDYMYVIDQGRIIADGIPKEIKRNPAVVAAYLGEPEHEEAR